MSAAIIKIKLRSGVREFEAEGPRVDIEALLERWWKPASTPDADEEDDETEVDGVGEKPLRRSTRKTATRRKAAKDGSSKTGEVDNQFDPTELTNRLKNDKKFETINSKIVNVKGDIYHKVLFVLWYAAKPMTSGQIQKVLTTLNIKSDLPRVSKSLSDNSSKFLLTTARTVGGTPAQYSLSAPAKIEFEDWLAKKND